MKIAHFAKLLKGNNGVRITDDLIVFNDFELYNLATDESKNYKSLAELIADNKDVEKIIAETKHFALRFDGGRGSSSGNEEMGGGFNHADQRGRKGENGWAELQNANLNFDTAKGNSLKAVLKRFHKKYGDADIEYGAAIDENGYSHKLRKGGTTSVSISGNKGQTVLHNHPSNGNFSDTDLISAATTDAKGVIATGSGVKASDRRTYHFQKNNNFKAKEFVKAVRNAKWPKNLDYNKGADWWLKKNQRAFGYKYSSSKLIGE